MKSSDEKAFAQSLGVLFAGKGRNPEGANWKLTLRAYWDALENFEFSTVRDVLKAANESTSPLPSAGELRAACAERISGKEVYQLPPREIDVEESKALIAELRRRLAKKNPDRLAGAMGPKGMA